METISLLSVKSLSDGGGGGGGDITKSEVISRDNNVLQNSKAYTDEKTPKDYIESVEKDTENQQIKLTDNKGNETSFNYGGGSGTSDYEDLINLPKINNITLTGNKSGIELGISRLIEVAENQTINGYQVPKLTADNITAIHNSVVAGIPTFVTDATGEYTYFVKQADSGSDELYVVFDFCDVMTLTYSLSGDTVQTTFKAFAEPETYLKEITKTESTITVTDNKGNSVSFSYGTNSYNDLANKPQINGVTLEGNIADIEELGGLRKRGAGTTHRAYTVLSNGNNNMRDITFEPVARNLVKWTENATLQSNNPLADLDVVNKQYFEAEILKKLDIAWGEENANKLLVINSEGNIALRENDETTAVSYWNLPVKIVYYTHDTQHEETIQAEVLEYAIAENEYLYTIKFQYSTEDESLIVEQNGSIYQTSYVVSVICDDHNFAQAICNNIVMSLGDDRQWIIGTNNEPSEGIIANFHIGKATTGNVSDFTINGYGQIVSNTRLLENGTPIVKTLNVKLASGGVAVDSVNGRTGDVVLTKADVGLNDVDNTSDSTKKLHFTGEIAGDDDGFVKGSDVYSALQEKQDSIDEYLTKIEKNEETNYITITDSTGLETGFPYNEVVDYEDLENKPQIGGVELTGNKSVEDIGALPKAGSGAVHRAYTVLSTGETEMREVSYSPKDRAIPKYSETGQLKSNDPSNELDVVNKRTFDASLTAKQDTLVSGTNIKTINGESVLGEGDITVSGEPNEYLKSVTKDTENQTITITDKSDNEVTFEYGSGGEGTTDYENLINKPQIGGVELTGNIDDVETLGALRKRGAGETHRAYTVLSNGDNNMRDITFEPVPRNLVKWTENATLQSENPKENLDVVNKQTFDTSLETKQDTLVSGTNIKTINGNSILGEGDIEVTGEPTEYLKSVTKDTENKTITIKDKDDNEVSFEYGGGGEGTSDYENLINKPQIGGVELVGSKSIEDLGGLQKVGEGDYHRAYTVLSTGETEMREISYVPKERAIPKYSELGVLKSNDPSSATDVVNKQTLDAELENKIADAPSDDYQYARRNAQWERVGEGVKFVTYTYDGTQLLDGENPISWEDFYAKCTDNNYDVAINYPDCPMGPEIKMMGLKWYYLLEEQMQENEVNFVGYSSLFRVFTGSDIKVTFRIKYVNNAWSFEFINKMDSFWAVPVVDNIATVAQWLTANQGTYTVYVKEQSIQLPARIFEVDTSKPEAEWIREIDFSKALFPKVVNEPGGFIGIGRQMTFRKRKYATSTAQYEKWVNGTNSDIESGLSVLEEQLKDNGERYLCFSDNKYPDEDKSYTDDIIETSDNVAKRTRRFCSVIGSVLAPETVLAPQITKPDVEYLIKREGGVLLAEGNWVGIPYYRGDKFVDVEVTSNGICLVTDGETAITKGFVNVEFAHLLDDPIVPPTT